MIALIQKVSFAKVFLCSELYSEIGEGLLVLVGVEKKDSSLNAERLADKLLAYRIFEDDLGKMNLSVKDKERDVMLVSQFTLAADTNKGLRPGFSSAKPPREAEKIFEYFLDFAKNFEVDFKFFLMNLDHIRYFCSSNFATIFFFLYLLYK